SSYALAPLVGAALAAGGVDGLVVRRICRLRRRVGVLLVGDASFRGAVGRGSGVGGIGSRVVGGRSAGLAGVVRLVGRVRARPGARLPVRFVDRSRGARVGGRLGGGGLRIGRRGGLLGAAVGGGGGRRRGRG